MIEVKPSKRHNVGGFALQPIPKGTHFTTNIPTGFRGFNYDTKPNVARFDVRTENILIALRNVKVGQELVLPPYKGKGLAFTTKNNTRALSKAGF